MRKNQIITAVLYVGLCLPSINFASETTGIWEPIPSMRNTGRKALEVLRDKYSILVRAEAGDFLTKLGLFAKQVKIAQSEAKVTIVSDDRNKLSLPIAIEDDLVQKARRRMKKSRGTRAFLSGGFLTIEYRGRHSIVTSTFACVPKERLLCQAVTIRDLGNRQPLILKHVLQPSQNKDRLPNPWKEPPSILPPPHKRKTNGFARGVQELINIGQMAVPFL